MDGKLLLLAGVGAAVWWYARSPQTQAIAQGPQIVTGPPPLGTASTTSTDPIIGSNQYGDPVTASGYVAPPPSNINADGKCISTSSQYPPDDPCYVAPSGWGL